jgi:hypothetical protein
LGVVGVTDEIQRLVAVEVVIGQTKLAIAFFEKQPRWMVVAHVEKTSTCELRRNCAGPAVDVAQPRDRAVGGVDDVEPPIELAIHLEDVGAYEGSAALQAGPTGELLSLGNRLLGEIDSNDFRA